MSNDILLWGVFNIFVVILLVIDLKVFHRDEHEVSVKEALVWSAVWISLALLFNLGLYFWQGGDKAMQFLAGYLIEKSLSMDNLFVFLLLFAYFGVAPKYQHDVLFWGILGALIMRGIFILAGVTLIEKFHWMIYVFGAFLIYTGVKLALEKDKEIHPENNPVLKLFRRFAPVSEEYHGKKFFIKQGKRLLATPLFLVLLVIETTDVIFAVDSVPAVLAVSRDPFIVYTSNVFAILGLRALYFALAGVMRMFHYLHYGLAAILVFVGLKMLVGGVGLEIHTAIALGVVGGILAISIAASMLWPPQKAAAETMPVEVE